jgi:hypothetical protein
MPTLLQNWKEIATHLKVSIRTAQRWEREFGLPVHHNGNRRSGSVFAILEELDSWLISRPMRHYPDIEKETGSNIFFAVDSEWRLTLVSAAAAHLWGGNQMALIGKFLWDVVPPDERNFGKTKIEEAIRTRHEVIFWAVSPLFGKPLKFVIMPMSTGGARIVLEPVRGEDVGSSGRGGSRMHAAGMN